MALRPHHVAHPFSEFSCRRPEDLLHSEVPVRANHDPQILSTPDRVSNPGQPVRKARALPIEPPRGSFIMDEATRTRVTELLGDWCKGKAMGTAKLMAPSTDAGLAQPLIDVRYLNLAIMLSGCVGREQGCDNPMHMGDTGGEQPSFFVSGLDSLHGGRSKRYYSRS